MDILLKEKIFEIVETIEIEDFGVAFSGGIGLNINLSNVAWEIFLVIKVFKHILLKYLSIRM